jgi:flagellar basal-body rod protein FlgF
MTQLGNGLYQTDQKPVAAEGTLIRQGFLEGSNVQVVSEVTRMIEINRDYQNIQKILQTEHDRLRNAYTKISKLA